ncbi:unnamed protein product, partial [Rotaria magnacalcarata]
MGIISQIDYRIHHVKKMFSILILVLLSCVKTQSYQQQQQQRQQPLLYNNYNPKPFYPQN